MSSRQNFIAALADSENLTKKQAESALKAVESLIVSDLTTHGQFQLTGIGILKVKAKTARTGRNPKTGAPLEIPAKRTLTITPAKAIKDVLNG